MKQHQSDSELSSLLADLQEDGVLAEVRRRIDEGDDLLHIVQECQKGVRLVGERYEQGVYYISGLIMASAIMHEVGDMVLPGLKTLVTGSESGRILLGTVEGDIHYIGKDIIKVLLRCYGFTVFDLGVDVPGREFLAKALDMRPAIVGLSCLIDSAFENMRATIDLLRREAGREGVAPSFIIGGCVDERVCRYVAADQWATDAMTGVRLCQQLIRGQGGGVTIVRGRPPAWSKSRSSAPCCGREATPYVQYGSARRSSQCIHISSIPTMSSSTRSGIECSHDRCRNFSGRKVGLLTGIPGGQPRFDALHKESIIIQRVFPDRKTTLLVLPTTDAFRWLRAFTECCVATKPLRPQYEFSLLPMKHLHPAQSFGLAYPAQVHLRPDEILAPQ